jgi:hypothetical protein
LTPRDFRKRLVLVVLVTLAAFPIAAVLGLRARCTKAIEPLPVSELTAEHYRYVEWPSDLPWAVQRDISHRGPVAAVGQPFNATDVISDPSLPSARLIAAAVGSRYVVVQVEVGGLGPFWYTGVFRQDGWSGWVVWNAPAERTYRDPEAFAAAIRSGEIWRVDH